jgi:catechol 2,3-dioxygenase-like lactoylglutathione lyase family enzyme
MNLNQVTVPSSNIPASIEFYQKLGLKLIVHTHDRYARFECPDGDSTLSIHYVEELPSGEGIYIYFEVADVEAKVHELRALGIWMETEAVEQSWLWTEARLKDPDRNQIIIFHAGANRKNPPWRREDDAGN